MVKPLKNYYSILKTGFKTGKNFLENAKIKAEYIFNKTKEPTIADDSYLTVFAIDNRPGIFSARYSEENGVKATDEKNNLKLLKELEGIEDRRAQYVFSFFVNKGKITYCFDYLKFLAKYIIQFVFLCYNKDDDKNII